MRAEGIDRRVRLQVYESFLADGRPPTIAETAELVDIPREEVAASFERLETDHVLVFASGTGNIWMANPLSAFPTPFWVETPSGGYWGTCIWDAFGIVAMLGGTGTVSTQCADCRAPFELSVADGILAEQEGVAHFAVPARRWWDDIGYT